MNGEPSQSEANKMLRVLKGIRRKMTVTIHLSDDRLIEFQTDTDPKVIWNPEDRHLWLYTSGISESYTLIPTMRWPDGAILLCERNPE